MAAGGYLVPIAAHVTLVLARSLIRKRPETRSRRFRVQNMQNIKAIRAQMGMNTKTKSLMVCSIVYKK